MLAAMWADLHRGSPGPLERCPITDGPVHYEFKRGMAMFIRTEKSIKDFMHFYPIVSVLVIINIVVFLMTDVIPIPAVASFDQCTIGFPPADTLGKQIFECGMAINPLVAQGEYWRLVTAMFLHGGLTHVLFNAFAIVLFAPALEQMLGKFKFIILYFVAGIVGNIGSYFVDPTMSSVGASGAIYGLFGLYVFMVVFRKDLIDRASMQIVMVIFIIGLLMSFMQTGINLSAHIFGFIGGFALGPVILGNARPFSVRRNRPRRKASDDGIYFQPTYGRKRKKRMNPDTLKKIIWTVIVILLAAGAMSALGIL